MSSSGLVVSTAPQLFKGIAVFTPGGDLVYCRDDKKRGQWHLNLCAALQEHLELAEQPHFLVPSFTATIDSWLDASTQSHHIIAEAYPSVHRYQGFLNALFGLENVEWRRIHPSQEERSLSIVDTYYSRFPQLWENHELILDISPQVAVVAEQETSPTDQAFSGGLVLRLFVSGHSAMTERILQTLQSVLDSSRYRPYTLQMIDVSKHPEQAEADQVSATPTLVRIVPQPTRRLVGALDNPRAILSLLSDS
ncbi:MAG: circadian clock protein KaiB [Leptolyngbya sp. SIO1D8]|nr:circadian clock protein KaiB [Leptolyngbya sp. SIO1D8]